MSEPRWQLIATAPKDADILVHELRFRTRVAYWNHKHECWRTIPGEVGIHPTHWMPLPDPPVAGAQTPGEAP